jgi:hypothetical protein
MPKKKVCSWTEAKDVPQELTRWLVMLAMLL